MGTKDQYKIVKAVSVEELQEKILKLIEEGWELLEPSGVMYEEGYYLRELVKKDSRKILKG